MDKGGEEGFLAVEIDIEGALRHAGGARYVSHARAVEAELEEDAAGTVEDLAKLGRVFAGGMALAGPRCRRRRGIGWVVRHGLYH